MAPEGDWLSDRVLLSVEETHHALHVLRVSPTETICVFDGNGTVARCAMDGVKDGRLVASIIDKRTEPRPWPEIALYQAAPKGAKLDDIVVRSAELGIAELRVFESMRTVVRWRGAKVAQLAARWHGRARAAAKQSRNPFVMRTGPSMTWPEMLDRIGKEPFVVTLWEDASTGLRDALPATAERIAVVVGPEGGFAAEEAEALAAAGAALVSLGPRIFRTEMASVAATAALLWHYRLIG
ncbi:MAG: rRNA (uracil1498-N3)-methyltransferase [Actinomycetota bacterium]|jgi:16S rRNA (uracil1498-N3)-methyltransferase|nr:rRNA (uracil1498-N3)-methyltransferase [Actinomycetota bacterium]